MKKARVEKAMQRAQLWFERWRDDFERQWNAQEREIENALALMAAKQFMQQTPPEVHQALAMKDPIEYQKVSTLAQQELPKPKKGRRGGK